MITILGWDIGGVNIKGAVLKYHRKQAPAFKVASQYFEIWKDRAALASVLRSLQKELMGADPGRPEAMAVTMTAELSDVFRTKREGVEFILNCVRDTFPEAFLYALDLEGRFTGPGEMGDPLRLAATNWLATALLLSKWHRNCLLMDIGSTTTDIVPILEGRVAARGNTDVSRLIAGELVYTGVLRTPVSSVVSHVPIKGEFCRVSAEYFAILGDVHLVLGNLAESDYVCETPDKRPKTRSFAQERLARVVCADSEMLSREEVTNLAGYIYEKQIQQVTEALMQVLSRVPSAHPLPVITCGLGEFLGKKCCERLGLRNQGIEEMLGPRASLVAPCVAVAYLLAEKLTPEGRKGREV